MQFPFVPSTFCGGTNRPPSSDSPDATGTEAGQDAVADTRPRLDGSPDAQVDAPGDGSVTDAELPSDAADASADANVVLPLCGGNVTLGIGNAPALSTAGDDYGLSLSRASFVAWATGAAGSVTTVHYADRANTSAAFGTARTFTGNYAATRIALSPDGLGIAMVNADGLGFTHLVRAQRSDMFATPDPALFVTLNDESAAMSAAGEKYAEPLWFTAGILIFSRYGGAIVDSTLAGSSVTDGPFSAGTPPFQGVAILQVVGGKRRVPDLCQCRRSLLLCLRPKHGQDAPCDGARRWCPYCHYRCGNDARPSSLSRLQDVLFRVGKPRRHLCRCTAVRAKRARRVVGFLPDLGEAQRRSSSFATDQRPSSAVQ